MEDTFRTSPTGRWATKDGRDVASFEQHISKELAKHADRLIWYTNPESKVPLWTQLILLWFRMRLLRQSPLKH